MTHFEAIDHLHITASGDWFASGLLADENAVWLEEHPDTVEQTVASRQCVAGFYTCFPYAIEHLIRRSLVSCLDLETTELTPQSPAIEITKQTKIGEQTWNQYRTCYPECKLNTTPRIRIVAITIHNRDLTGKPCTESFAFDVDALSPEDRERLFDAVVDGQHLLGHNLGFDLNWLFNQTRCRPAFVLDSLLLVRQCDPSLLLGLNQTAATGPLAEQEEAIELLTGAGENGGGNLEYLSTIVGLPRPSKAHQKPANWCVSILSPEHHRYIMSDIDAPIKILRTIFGAIDPKELMPKLREEFPWYIHYQNALIKHACLHGMPFDHESAAKIRHRYTQACHAVANRFARKWESIFTTEVVAILADRAKGDTSDIVKQAFAAVAASKGIELPRTETGDVGTSLKDWRYGGIDQSLPELYNLRKKLSDYKKGIEMIDSLFDFAKADGYIHPLVNFSTAAGRASSQNPNVQGFPRDRRLRRAFGRRGKRVVKVDYSSIELRIGASLANRAIKHTRSLLKDIRSSHEFEDRNYFLKNAWLGNQTAQIAFPPEAPPDHRSEDDWRMERPARLIQYYAQRVLRLEKQCLETAFEHRIDPHLVTGLTMLCRAGRFEVEGDIVAWLRERSKSETKELKERHATARQQAKAVNFGLLYFMSGAGLHRYGIESYGVKWSAEEAASDREAWFGLYPELGFLHCYIHYYCRRKQLACRYKVYNSYTRQVETPKWDVSVYTPTTLTGRPFAILASKTRALAYPGQGSGADILTRAVSYLSPRLTDALALTVHDEIVLVVDESEDAEDYRHELEETMIRAAAEIITDIRIEVEGAVADCWTK